MLKPSESDLATLEWQISPMIATFKFLNEPLDCLMLRRSRSPCVGWEIDDSPALISDVSLLTFSIRFLNKLREANQYRETV